MKHNIPTLGFIIRKLFNLTPKVGDCYSIIDGRGKYHSYRVTGFMNENTKERCQRKDVTHVSGYGICGDVSRIAAIKLDRQVGWSYRSILKKRRCNTDFVNRLIAHNAAYVPSDVVF